MTLTQLAIASRSSVAWLSNSARILGRRLVRTTDSARWWCMVRMFNADLGVGLASASRAADSILGVDSAVRRVRIAGSEDESIILNIDLERFHSTCNAALAAAWAFAPPGKRGRPRRSFASARPKDAHLSEVWIIQVDDAPEALERLARHLAEWKAYPRGIEPGLPFFMDMKTLRALPRLALTSEKGPIDVVVERRGAADRSRREATAAPPSS